MYRGGNPQCGVRVVVLDLVPIPGFVEHPQRVARRLNDLDPAVAGTNLAEFSRVSRRWTGRGGSRGQDETRLGEQRVAE